MSEPVCEVCEKPIVGPSIFDVEEGLEFCGPCAVSLIGAERDHYREALKYIDGCFPEPGRRVTYGDPDATMDRIRARAGEALSLRAGCSCVGTSEQEDCPHE